MSLAEVLVTVGVGLGVGLAALWAELRNDSAKRALWRDRGS